MDNKLLDISKNLSSRRDTCYGIESKFWVNINGTDYLYKYYNAERAKKLIVRDEMRTFNEVLVSRLCKKLGIDCVDVSFAKAVLMQNPELKIDEPVKTKGCLIKSYLEPNTEAISLESIQQFYENENELKSYEVNNPHSAYETIRFFCEKNGYILDSKTPNMLKAIALFDFVTKQADRHSENIELLSYVKNGEKHLKIAPMFDNGRCFGSRDLNEEAKSIPDYSYNLFLMNGLFNSSDPDVLFSYANGIAYEMKKDEYLIELFNKIKQIDIAKEVDELLETSGATILPNAKNFIVQSWQSSIKEIDCAVLRMQDPDEIKKIENGIEKFSRQDYALKHNFRITQEDCYLLYRCAKAHGRKESFEEYLQQAEKYKQSVEDWQTLRTDTMPNRSDFSLLDQNFSKNHKQNMRAVIETEQFNRRREIQTYVHHYVIKKYPKLSDANVINQSIWNMFTAWKIGWIKYGEDKYKRPSIEAVMSEFAEKQSQDFFSKDKEGGRE